MRLIKRYSKFKGYGFVGVANGEDLEEIVNAFNGLDVKGRPMKVQPAEPKKAYVEGEDSEPIKRAPKPKVPSTLIQVEKEKVETLGADGEVVKPKKKKRVRKPRSAVEKDEAETGPKSESEPKVAKPRAPYPPRKIRDPNSPLSDTVVFVGNLPFQVNDEDLGLVFEGYAVVSARVVKYGTRSKGFGFVEFAAGDVEKVLSEFEGAVLEERELVLKRAYAADEKIGN